MSKIKKVLAFVVLVVSTCFLFVSCSCSFGKNRGGSENGGGGGGETPAATTYYSVTVEINNSAGGSCESKSGSNSHEAGSSPVYVIKPSETWAIKKIKIDKSIFYSFDMDGYLFDEKEVVIPSISADTTISVEFAQIWFDISLEVASGGFADPLGGTITEVDSEKEGRYLGGESAAFEVVPNDGYIIHSILVNGDSFYTYSVADHLASEEMSVVIEKVNENTTIVAEFFKKEDFGGAVVNIHSGTNSLGDKGEWEQAESLVSYSVLGYSGLTGIPNGAGGTIKLEPKPYLNIVAYAVSFDGGEFYYPKMRAADEYFGDDFSFNPETLTLEFGELSKLIRIKVFTEAEEKNLVIYNATTRETSEPVAVNVYSFMIIQDWMANFDWFYSLDSAYQESNTHRPVEIHQVVSGGDTIYSIYIDPEFVGYADRIVLIYKSN